MAAYCMAEEKGTRALIKWKEMNKQKENLGKKLIQFPVVIWVLSNEKNHVILATATVETLCIDQMYIILLYTMSSFCPWKGHYNTEITFPPY